MFTVVVVLPTPPFWLATAMIRVTWDRRCLVAQGWWDPATPGPDSREADQTSMFPVKHRSANLSRLIHCDWRSSRPHCALASLAMTTVVGGSTTP